MKLVRRRIPGGGAYEVPGEPTMTMRLASDAPLAAGRTARSADVGPSVQRRG